VKLNALGWLTSEQINRSAGVLACSTFSENRVCVRPSLTNMTNFADRLKLDLRRPIGWVVVLLALLWMLSACGTVSTSVPTTPVPPVVSDRDQAPQPSSSNSVNSPSSSNSPDAMTFSTSLPDRPQLRVNPDRLMQRLTDFSQPRFSEADRELARQYLEQVLTDQGWQVRREPFTIPRDDAPELNGVNLVAEKLGTDPTLPPLLIGAHYDTVSNQSPGADDNGSGAIGLLEIAEVLAPLSSQAGTESVATFRRTLRLVWFDLEEFGLLGSFYHVAQLDRALYGAIILEMIGYACDQPGCQQVPSGLAIALPDRGNFLGVVGNADAPDLLAPFAAIGEASDGDRDRLGYPPVITLAVPTRLAIAPNLLRSDHVPFWAEGIGALMVTDTADFRNPNYHRSSDTVETIDRLFLAGSTQVVLDGAIGLLE